MTFILSALSGLWSKVWGYVVAGGAVVALLAGIYIKGRQDAKSSIQIKQVKKDLNDLQGANKIDESVRTLSESDVDAKLSKWMRNDQK
jgi:hypothetical protein